MIMDIIRLIILFVIIFAVLKNFKTLLKAAIVLFVISILLRIAGL